MPRRPRTHQTETAGMRAFERELPDAWTFDTPSQGNDYGVDGTVELFTDDGETEGLGFHVQVRATDADDLRPALAYAFKTEALDHYLRLDRPVLLVRYHRPTDALFVRWAHRSRLYAGSRDRATETVRWTEGDRWDAETPGRLACDVRRFRDARAAALARPVGVHVTVRCGDVLSPKRARFLRRAFRLVQGGEVAVRVGGQSRNETAQVAVDDDGLTVDFGGVTGLYTDLPRRLDSAEDAEGLVDTALCMAGLCAASVGHAELGASLVDRHLEGASLAYSPPFAWSAVSALLGGGRSGLAVSYVEHLLDVAGDAAAVLESASAGVSSLRASAAGAGGGADDNEGLVDRLLAQVVSVAAHHGGGGALGAALYTRANHLFVERGEPDRVREALSLYNRARKAEPAYDSRPYFASEVAGALFGLSRYGPAVVWYQRAVELGDDGPDTRAYLGDALLMSGRFEAAVAELAVWGGNPWERPFWWLKYRTAKRLLQAYGPAVRRRQSAAAQLPWPDDGATDEERFADARKRLALDPLNAGAAFNAGLALMGEGRAREAAPLFTQAALTHPADVEAWRNAFLAVASGPVRGGDPVERLAIGTAAYGACGTAFVGALHDAIDEQPDEIDPDMLEDVVDAIREIAPVPAPEPFFVRTYGGEPEASVQ